MDELDNKIINALQNDFPVRRQPYNIIAGKLQVPYDKLFDKVQELIADGVIRRIGLSINSHKLGFNSSLAAINVGPDKIKKASKIISRFHEVTHCYQRNHSFNIWFTVIAPTKERIVQILTEIRSELSLKPNQMFNLPMKKIFKLNTRFKIL